MVSGEWPNGMKETVVCSPTKGHQWQDENEKEKKKREAKRSDGQREREKEGNKNGALLPQPTSYFNDFLAAHKKLSFASAPNLTLSSLDSIHTIKYAMLFYLVET